MRDWKDSVLCSIFKCGYADLSLIEKCEYCVDDIIEEVKMQGFELDINTFMLICFRRGLSEIEDALNMRRAELEAIPNERKLTPEEEEELSALNELNPQEDAEMYFNFLDTHIWWRDDDKGAYEEYLPEAMEKFYEMTGFEIG